MMTRAKFVLGLLLCLSMFGTPGAYAQDKPYKEGTVWQVTFIKVKPGMFDVYMNDLLPNRRKLYEESRKQGLVISEKMLTGDSFGNGDFNIMLMTEFKNYAALDGLSDKYDALMAKVVGAKDAQVKVMVKRTEMREIIGDKLMQEIHYK
ncbi:hypothetical protein GJ700_27735 [Duganella sp. FT92W]|uniref:Uncharacterized protein n=1 Tax=Pseudoduganella rivuli TaxID=2666085 RepID=A0A7X2IU35_9BURK|nr:hypothetical protein [Pseudoduganella rivuli]MRV75518.1 hypothetical protein [Pseudoduganella rivuli]